MEYTRTYSILKSIFLTGKTEILLPGSGINIRNVSFISDPPPDDLISENDKRISENSSFSYPVFSPPDTGSRRVILLLHGLNERSWIKYLPWAVSLAERTGSHVILFPISFHINRSPASWKDPRAMTTLLKCTNSNTGGTGLSSFANAAISNRLAEDPMRFLKAGYQTAADISVVVSEIRRGKHPLIPQTENVNIFAYSIGAFLAEIIMMGNPDSLFSSSRLFILAGGSVFSRMKGASRFIMDNRAFDRIYNYYLNDFEKTIKGKSTLNEFLRSSQLGIAFRSMIDLGRFRSFRENILKKLRDQIRTISLSGDTVIPPDGIMATLNPSNKGDNIRVWDFPFSYSHENPFPVFDSPLSKKVDLWFERVFTEAAQFLI